MEIGNSKLKTSVGGGLHDSSAALLPFLKKSKSRLPEIQNRKSKIENFLLFSTGTWCIVLNPFNPEPLTEEQLRRDCLCYLTPEGRQVKASRIFFGREHDFQVGRIAEHFGVAADFFKKIKPSAVVENQQFQPENFTPACMTGTGPFPERPPGAWDVGRFSNPETAYLALLDGLLALLKTSVELVADGVPTFFVDGGFARNPIFLRKLRAVFPGKKIVASELPQATALGALLHLKTARHGN